MSGYIAVKPLVKSMGPQQMGWGAGGGYVPFALPPYGRHVVHPGEDCTFLYIKTICDTIFLKDTSVRFQV